MKKTLLWLLVLLMSVSMVATFSLAGCKPEVAEEEVAEEEVAEEEVAEEEVAEEEVAEEPVTLVVWDEFTEGAGNLAIEKIYALFMEQNPNITIEAEHYTWDQLSTIARTALASDTGPDVGYLDIGYTRELIKADLIESLDEYAQQYGWNERLSESGLSWTKSDDHLWGLGYEAEFVGIFYNQTIFDEEGWEVPQTLSEALDFSRTAKAAGYLPMAHSHNPGWQCFFSFTMPVHNYVGVDYMEGLLFRDEGAWNTPDMIAAVKTVSHDMKDAGSFDDDLNGLDWDTAVSLFVNREAVMLPTGTWVIGQIAELDETDDIRMMPWFDMETGQPRVYTMGMGSAWYMSANSNNKDAAAKFIEFCFSDEAVKIWIEDGKRIAPVHIDTDDLDIDPLTKFAVDTLGSDLTFGWDVDLIVPQEFNEMIISGFQGTYAGTKTDEQQMNDLQAIWEAR